MATNTIELPVLTNPELLEKNKIVYPVMLSQAIDLINPIILEESIGQQKQAKKIINSWVKTLWSSMIIISNKVTNNQNEKREFQVEFETKLIDFITHVDHGIIHAYHVYKGMLFLDKKESNKLKPGSQFDKRAQLMALLHDSMQVLPFSIKGDSCKLEYQNPKNEHADIIADITQRFSYVVGFNPDALANIVFGLRNHDGSYNENEDYLSSKFKYVSKLLHDSDKIFGASYSTDIKVLVSGMLRRNFRANKGGKGSYLVRDLTDEIRDLIIYGDRCFSDSVSLVRKEFNLKMTTKIGKEIARARRKYTIQQVTKVYGRYFDMAYESIFQTLVPKLGNLGKNDSKLALSIVGMDQEEQEINSQIKNINDLESLITQLYNTPITIKDDAIFEDRYNTQEDARGLKIRIYNIESKDEYFIDPSIARFFFEPNGRDNFLELITGVFSSVADDKTKE